MKTETCWKCEGSGKIRNNKYTNGGFPITFHKDVCDECNGTGNVTCTYEGKEQ